MLELMGNFGICYFQDCLEGMKELGNATYQYCFTDYPYNVKYKNKDCSYEDNKENYAEWVQLIWKEIIRITTSQVITVGLTNGELWSKFAYPMDKIYHHKPDGQGVLKYSYLNKVEEVYLYNLPKRYPMNYIKGTLDLGDRWIHPCPKSLKLWRQLIFKQLPMRSVLDPFLGSGTTAEVCEELGINWIGFELNEQYSPDIKKRIQRGISKHKQLRKQLTLI
jgi:site-specific DNA-methyltransferase (adenine-specific)